MTKKPLICEGFSDEEMVSLVLADPDHYLCLMRRYEAPLLRYVARITGFIPEDVEDVVQEVFLKAYVNLRDFDVSLRFSAWLYRIAHNEAISTHRKRQARPKAVAIEDETEERLFFERATADAGFAERMAERYDAELVRAAIDALDEKYREVLILRYMEQKDYEEISDILRKPPGTVATLISRAKQRLKEELTTRGFN